MLIKVPKFNENYEKCKERELALAVICVGNSLSLPDLTGVEAESKQVLGSQDQVMFEIGQTNLAGLGLNLLIYKHTDEYRYLAPLEVLLGMPHDWTALVHVWTPKKVQADVVCFFRANTLPVTKDTHGNPIAIIKPDNTQETLLLTPERFREILEIKNDSPVQPKGTPVS